jgi:predicted nucleic acid-binding protein
MESLSEVLARHQRIALDSHVLLYFFEAHPEFGPPSRAVMRAVADGLPAVTTVLTLLDALVMPRRLRDQEIYDQHLTVLTTFPHLTLVPIDQAMAREAAELRARYPALRTPDALAIAAGLAHGATLYVTNDPRSFQVSEIQRLNLRDVVL